MVDRLLPNTDDDVLPEIEVVQPDLASLDVDAAVDEIVTGIHWIEDHVPGHS